MLVLPLACTAWWRLMQGMPKISTHTVYFNTNVLKCWFDFGCCRRTAAGQPGDPYHGRESPEASHVERGWPGSALQDTPWPRSAAYADVQWHRVWQQIHHQNCFWWGSAWVWVSLLVMQTLWFSEWQHDYSEHFVSGEGVHEFGWVCWLYRLWFSDWQHHYCENFVSGEGSAWVIWYTFVGYADFK